MAHITEVKFKDLQLDERYKKLERDLKLASLKKKYDKEENQSLSSSLPALSGINMRSTISNTNVPIVCIPRIDDVVSSSQNLKNMVSEKGYGKQSDKQKDFLTMQPPSSHVVFRSAIKSNETLKPNAKALPMIQNRHMSSYTTSESKRQNLKLFNIDSLQMDSCNLQNEDDIVFRKWKVMLTEQGQLVIKGTLKGENVVQSKPIIKRLTSTTVQSAFKDLYHLQGNIVDDEHELPDYVRGKFYNGFPDDWENVYKIWKTFIKQGCKLSFRWPTSIADSDDELKSEVTDVTYLYTENSKQQVSNFEHFKKYSPEVSLCSEYLLNVSKEKDDTSLKLHNFEKRNASTQTSTSDIVENSSSNVDIQTSLNQYNYNTELYEKQENNNLKDKLNDILNSLMDKDCPHKCIKEIIRIIDCLNHVVSFRSNKGNESCMEHFSTYKSERNKKLNNTFEKLESISLKEDIAHDRSVYNNTVSYHTYIPEEECNIMGNESVNSNRSLQRKRTFVEMNKDNDDSSSESESEIYAGIPRIPLRRLQRRKETFIKPRKRKMKKRVRHKHDINKQSSANLSASVNYAGLLQFQQQNSIYVNNSNVNRKDETCFLKVGKQDSNPTIQSKITKPIDFYITTKDQWNEVNDFSKGNNRYEVQEHSMHNQLTSIHRPEDQFFNSLKDTESGGCRNTITGNNKDIVKRMNSNVVETSGGTDSNIRETANYMKSNATPTNTKKSENTDNKCSDPTEQPLYHVKNSTSKIAKPTIIRTEPINIEIENLKLKHYLQKKTNTVENKSTDIKQSIKENESNSCIQGRSSTKCNAIGESINLTVLRDSKKLSNVQLGNVDSTTLKKTTNTNLEIFKGNQENTSCCKPKLLTAWVPKILDNSGLSLIFEGTLLNDAGHVTHKKFRTDVILRRITPKLIETVHHELYKLVGDLNNTKHVVPKQLINYCRYGCPSRIDRFCKTWKLLQTNNEKNSMDFIENSHDKSVDTINVGISSKGRRIIPPLSYWTGERIILKNGNPVYNPGILRETSNKNQYVLESSSDESETSLKANNVITRGKSRKFGMQNKKGISCLKYSSDSDSLAGRERHLVKTTKQTPSNYENIMNKQSAHSTSVENSYGPHAKLNTTKTNENVDSSNSKQMSMNHQFSRGKHHDVICTYYQDIPFKDDVLSDDQESHV